MVDLTQGDIDQILDLHNTLRNKIASGGEKGFKSASKMSVLVRFQYKIKNIKKILIKEKIQKWDTELAALAEFNVKQCKIKHDQCRATSQFPYAGQNLGVRSNTADYEDKSSVIKNVINAWYDEIKDAKSSNIAKCCGPAHKIGHFTQVVRDEAVSVGCAISKYADKKWKNLLMACNYSITNMVSQPVYAAGSPASGCSTGGNGKYTSLCN